MFPSRFAYVRPDTLDEALEVLAEHGEEARPLAGGQSLIPLMKLRVVFPGVVVDLNRIPGLDALTMDERWLRMGALTRHVQVEEYPGLRERLPHVHEAVRTLGDVQVRNLGTVAGAAAEADPAGDWGPVFLALGGEVACVSRAGQRVVAIEDFFVDFLTSDLAPTELISEVRLRTPPASRTGGAFVKLERRVGDFAVVAVAAQVTLDPDGTCREAGIGLSGVGLTPVKAAEVEQALCGTSLDDDTVRAAGELLASAISPLDDGRGPAWYKRDMAGVVFGRAVSRAAERARAHG